MKPKEEKIIELALTYFMANLEDVKEAYREIGEDDLINSITYEDVEALLENLEATVAI